MRKSRKNTGHVLRGASRNAVCRCYRCNHSVENPTYVPGDGPVCTECFTPSDVELEEFIDPDDL